MILAFSTICSKGHPKADKADNVDFFEWFAIGHHVLLAGFLVRFLSAAGLPAGFLNYCLGLNLPAGFLNSCLGAILPVEKSHSEHVFSTGRLIPKKEIKNPLPHAYSSGDE